MSVVEAIAPARFAEWVDRRRLQVVFLGEGPSTPRSTSVVRGFDLAFREPVGLGWMSRSTSRDPAWWAQHWRTRLGPCDVREVPAAGVWLFVDSFVAGYHGFPPQPGATDAWTGIRAYLLDRIRLKLAASADDAGPWTSHSASTPPPGPAPDASPRGGHALPPAGPRPPPPGGPYALLEVSPDATDAELRSAFLAAVKLNHPDRVAHLSVAIQDFARERTQHILTAWAAIKRERNLR